MARDIQKGEGGSNLSETSYHPEELPVSDAEGDFDAVAAEMRRRFGWAKLERVPPPSEQP